MPAPRKKAVPVPVLPLRLRELHAAHAAALAPVWNPRTGLTVKIKTGGGPVWPARTRCKACRKSFGDLVVLQMFCSYRCAGLPKPGTDPEAAPRGCRREARPHENTPGGWVFKRRFRTEAEALEWRQLGKEVYRCDFCFELHTGSSLPVPAGKARAGKPVAAPKAEWPSQAQFDRCVTALLAARGVARRTKTAVADAERDTRAVLAVLRAGKPS